MELISPIWYRYWPHLWLSARILLAWQIQKYQILLRYVYFLRATKTWIWSKQTADETCPTGRIEVSNHLRRLCPHANESLRLELCEAFGIKQNLHVSCRPQSSRNLERQHRTLKNSLFATLTKKQNPAASFVIKATSNDPLSYGLNLRSVLVQIHSFEFLPNPNVLKPVSIAENPSLRRSDRAKRKFNWFTINGRTGAFIVVCTHHFKIIPGLKYV